MADDLRDGGKIFGTKIVKEVNLDDVENAMKESE